MTDTSLPDTPASDAPPVLDETFLSILRQMDAPGESTVLAQLVETFLGDADLYHGAIRRAFAERDAAGVRDAAHALKGAAGSIGATRLASVLAALEGASGSALSPEVPPLVDELDRSITLTRAAFSELVR
jgi:HPt (histidine-containing phosphotransfer) domain-containing protein